MKNVIKLRNIEKIYSIKNENVIALSDLTVSFEPNKFYAIMGHSGSGKSTLINILGLLIDSSGGDYYLNDVNIKDLTQNQLAYERMKNIGFVFQQFYLEENLTALENVCLPMLINKEIKKEDRVKIATNLLNELGLSNRINHRPKELSGGEQQRVAIARALANNPNILLCDEPTGNLDEENEKVVFNLLKKLSKEGKCVIVVSHSPEVKNYADEIFNITKGKLSVSNEK